MADLRENKLPVCTRQAEKVIFMKTANHRVFLTLSGEWGVPVPGKTFERAAAAGAGVGSQLLHDRVT